MSTRKDAGPQSVAVRLACGHTAKYAPAPTTEAILWCHRCRDYFRVTVIVSGRRATA